jgi:hypothetical protein
MSALPLFLRIFRMVEFASPNDPTALRELIRSITQNYS